MRVLVLGAGGMLGHRLWRDFDGWFDTFATSRAKSPAFSALGLNTEKLLTHVDVLNLETVADALSQTRPDVVVNCVGVIKQLAAAKDPVASVKINSLFPHQLASLCRASGPRVIHISTDCVFSGQTGMYTEADIPDPVDLYGRTKLVGEVFGEGAVTLRTSIIGRELDSRVSLIDWFLAQRGTANGYRRALYTGFTTAELSRIIASVIRDFPDLSGLYQVSSGPINKFDLLDLVQRTFNVPVELTPVDEPVIDRSLDSSRFRMATGYVPPTWKEMIEEMAGERVPYDRLRTRSVNG